MGLENGPSVSEGPTLSVSSSSASRHHKLMQNLRLSLPRLLRELLESPDPGLEAMRLRMATRQAALLLVDRVLEVAPEADTRALLNRSRLVNSHLP